MQTTNIVRQTLIVEDRQHVGWATCGFIVRCKTYEKRHPLTPHDFASLWMGTLECVALVARILVPHWDIKAVRDIVREWLTTVILGKACEPQGASPVLLLLAMEHVGKKQARYVEVAKHVLRRVEVLTWEGRHPRE